MRVTESEENELRRLRQLARLYGVQTGYYDVIARRRREATSDALRAVLAALGVPTEHLKNLSTGLQARRLARWQRSLEPVVVAWEGNLQFRLRQPGARAEEKIACTLRREDGHVESHALDPAEGVILRAREIEGTRYTLRGFGWPGRLPHGYHRLHIEVGGQSWEALVIAAPLEAYTPAEWGAQRENPGVKTWGAFLPLYALRSLGSWGTGDFTDLEALRDWVGARGGRVVATLPLLATFLDELFEPSPYAPVSRLFWNELYLDVTRLPEFARCATAQALVASSETQRELEALQAGRLVDYRRAMALKRKILEELAHCFFAQPAERQTDFRRFLEAQPALEDYARFRAVTERQRAPWPAWPEPARSGTLQPGDYEQAVQRYHLYVQWRTAEQLEALSNKGRGNRPGLYLDLAVGVNRCGYDVWRDPSAFALNFDTGAPPDALFTKGQNWGFPPPQPDRMRETGYRYTIAYLRHHLRTAAMLRIDHVMGLHRLFWIPPGAPAVEGVYVRYPAEELYAILTLESQRHKTVLVGEDLGTVPFYVRPALARHRMLGTYVLPFELNPDSANPLQPPQPEQLAVLNTHDMPTFTGWWQGLDISDRVEFGLLEPGDAPAEREKRRRQLEALISFLRHEGWLANPSAEPPEVLRACLAYLGASAARVMVVNLEDLWLDTQQQNAPGTVTERPNWQQKARYSLEALCQLPLVLDTLREVNRQRKRAGRK